jgi:DnaJ-class molecular chaperone
MKDYFKIFGISKNSSQEEIDKQYRNLVLKYHPDKNPEAVDKFKEIQEAYEFLKVRKSSFSFSSKNSVDDIFDNLFSKIFGDQKSNISSKIRLKIYS